MANYPIDATAGEIGAYAKTPVAATEDTVTITRGANWGASVVEVTSDGTAALYFTVDGSAPTVAGKKTREMPAGATSVRQAKLPAGVTQVRLISAGTPKYSVAIEA